MAVLRLRMHQRIHYTIYKIFDAKVNAEGTSVAYTKKIFLKILILKRIQQEI